MVPLFFKFKRYPESLSHPIIDNQDCGRIYYDTDHSLTTAPKNTSMNREMPRPNRKRRKAYRGCDKKVYRIPGGLFEKVLNHSLLNAIFTFCLIRTSKLHMAAEYISRPINNFKIVPRNISILMNRSRSTARIDAAIYFITP